MERTRVTFLGTGDAYCAGGRHMAAYLIEGPEGSLLLDCGATVLASLNRQGLPAARVDAVLLSHLHGDHYGGLPFLFLHYMYIEPRVRPLKIIGPPEVEIRVQALFRAMYADTAAEPLPFELEFVEIRPQETLRLGGMQVDAFSAVHQKQPPSLAFEIKGNGWKIVYTGDSGWAEELVGHTQNADLFICECSFFKTRLETHLDYPRIAENAGRFGAKRLVLTHLGREMLARAEEVSMEMAHDGLVVEL
jgi:ribonuclease BN (tRNA processing enzyme)